MRINVEDILRGVDVKVEGDQLTLTGQVTVSVQMSEEREHVPDVLEDDVEGFGQELKRVVYQVLLERADQEEVLRMRDGKNGQGIQQRGTRLLSFHTRFGLVPVARKRITHRGDGSTEVPSARAWKSPQHDYITRGLRHEVCDELQDRTLQRSCEAISKRAGQPNFLKDVTALNILHQEGARLIAAQRARAESLLAKAPTACPRLVPPEAVGKKKRPTSPAELPEDLSEEQTAEALQIAVGFLDPDSCEATGAAALDEERDLPEHPPRQVDAGWVIAQLDEVKVKAQACWVGKEIWLYTGTVLVEGSTYYLVEETQDKLYRQLAGLLSVLGVLEGRRQLLALGDGATWIRNWYKYLKVPGKSMILCWYHLAKRCYQRLSAAGFDKPRRQELEQQLLRHLWIGDVSGALSLLADVHDEARNPHWIDDMSEYLKKRIDYLPNYKARHKAGLWIASNRVEKWNDWSVSDRCKRRGMSWVAHGVHALAAHEAARRNGELAAWRAADRLPAWSAPTPAKQAA